MRPLSPEALGNLEHYYDLEITYSSNAIEGNTLTPVETTLVIEQGITIAGKPLRDHLEALDRYDALRYVRELARKKTPLTESDPRSAIRARFPAACVITCRSPKPFLNDPPGGFFISGAAGSP